MLVDAAHDAVFFFGAERLGAEVVDAVVEAALDEVLIHLKEVVSQCICLSRIREHHTVMNSFICFFSIRAPSSRCSDALRLQQMLAGLVTPWIACLPFHCVLCCEDKLEMCGVEPSL